MTIVSFRKETDKLTQICKKKFKNFVAAKKFIEDDAMLFLTKHKGFDLGWIKPKTLDYYCIELMNGTKCYWQYFEV